jgi:MraZ protein
MEPNAASELVFYNSVYRHGVDAKRRVQIPAKWRSGRAEKLMLLLWPKGSMRDACLLVLPLTEWLMLVQKLKAMPFSDPKAQAARHLVGKKSDSVKVDKAGRICLPEEMAQAAGIDQEAVLVGLVDRFEIWNPERYEVVSALDEQMSTEAFQLI